MLFDIVWFYSIYKWTLGIICLSLFTDTTGDMFMDVYGLLILISSSYNKLCMHAQVHAKV